MADLQHQGGQEATDRVWSAAVRDMRLVLNHLNVANQIDRRLNAWRTRWRINPTQMLLLAELQADGAGESNAKSGFQASASELAERMQLSRAMLAAQLKGLLAKNLVEMAEVGEHEDQRVSRYQLTAKGRKNATEATKLLGQVAIYLRNALGHPLSDDYVKSLDKLVERFPSEPDVKESDIKGPVIKVLNTAQGHRVNTINGRKKETMAARGLKKRGVKVLD